MAEAKMGSLAQTCSNKHKMAAMSTNGNGNNTK